MLPRKTDARAFPLATYLLILAQLIVWFIVRRYLLAGNAWTDLAMVPRRPNLLGLLISPFVHVEATHLGVNLLTLWLFGTNLERAVRSLPFLLIYLGAAWFAGLMYWATSISFHLYPDLAAHGAAVGSSGAIAGVLGASVVRFAQPRLRVPFLTRATFPVTPLIVLWLLYTLIRAVLTTVSGVTEGVGHWAHFAGFVFGLGVAQLLGMQRVAREDYLIGLAQEAGEREDFTGASRAWSALLQLRPNDPQVRTALIQARLGLHDYPEARKLAREGLEALVRRQKKSEAIDSFLQYSEWIPELDLPPGVRFRVGCWLAEAGHCHPAFQALCESVREDGATTASSGALFRAGQIAWERLRDPQQARRAWEQLVQEFPESPLADNAREELRKLPTLSPRPA